MMLEPVFELKASSDTHDATITTLDGKVMLLTAEQGVGPLVKFDGKSYSLIFPKPGRKVRNGDLLRTFPAAQARIVFNNGDQVNLVAGSAYQIRWAAGRAPVLTLLQGALRSTVEPGGPREGMTVRSRAAVMGVRGTEFFVEETGTGAQARSNFVVLRGKAELRKLSAAGVISKPVVVSQGQVATVVAPETVGAASQSSGASQGAVTVPLVVQPASKEELGRAEEALKVPAHGAASGIAPAEVSEEIRDLEKKAVQVVLSDVKVHEPELYKKIEKDSGGREALAHLDPEKLREVQNQAIADQKVKAPSRPEPETAATPSKPSIEELEKAGEP
jgi:hypothetical protein